MAEGYLKGPWRCNGCGRIFESLDEPSAAQGQPGKEPVQYCAECRRLVGDDTEMEGLDRIVGL